MLSMYIINKNRMNLLVNFVIYSVHVFRTIFHFHNTFSQIDYDIISKSLDYRPFGNGAGNWGEFQI